MYFNYFYEIIIKLFIFLKISVLVICVGLCTGDFKESLLVFTSYRDIRLG